MPTSAYIYKAFLSYSHAVDGRLAPALQSALHRFAKPWYKLRAVWVFRDRTDLSASPGVWPEILKALEQSEFLLLMASPTSAGSEWVRKELTFWVEKRDPAKLIIVLTDGSVAWDNAAGDFDWSRTSALPELLRGAFKQEPLYVDLVWAKGVDQLSTRHPEFLDRVATIAAALHGRPKGVIFGEDVRQYRRARQLAWSAATILLLLLVVTGVAAIGAYWQYTIAEQSRLVAERRLAENYLDEAQTLCERGEIHKGMHVLVKSLQQAAQAEDVDLECHIRQNLGSWAAECSHVQAVIAASQGVADFSLSPDGNFLLSVSTAHKAQIWDVHNGSLVGELPHRANVTKAVFSDDGKTVITSCGDLSESAPAAAWGEVQRWETSTRQPIGRPIAVTGSMVIDLAVSPNSRTIMTATDKHATQFWQTDTGEPYGPPEFHGDAVDLIGFTSSGSHALATSGVRALLWSEKEDFVSSRPLLHFGAVYKAVFSPDGQHVLTADEKGARLWEVESGMQDGKLMSHDATNSAVITAAFAPDGLSLATAGIEGTVRIWSVSSNEPVLTPLRPQIAVAVLAFSLDGSLLVTCAVDQTVQLWEVASGRAVGPPMFQTGDSLLTIVMNSDRKTFVTGGASDRAYVRTIPAGLTARQTFPHQSDALLLRGQLLSPDGQTAVVQGASENIVQLWDTATGRARGSPLTHEKRDPKKSSTVRYVTFSQDGRDVLTGALDGTLRIWETSSGRARGAPLLHEESIDKILVCPQNRVVAVAQGSSVRIWGLESRKSTGVELRHQSYVRDIAFSPDGSLILTGSDDNTGRLWDVETGALRRTLEMKKPVTYVAFHPQRKLVFTATDSNTDRSGGEVQMWNMESGEQFGSTMHHEIELSVATWSASGKLVLTAGEDKVARVWDAFTGKTTIPPLLHRYYVNGAAFSPDESLVLTGTGDFASNGEIALWNVKHGKALGRKALFPSPLHRVGFSCDASRIWFNSPTALHIWKLATPVTGDIRQVGMWTEVITGMEADEFGALRPLNPEEWQARRKTLGELTAD
jgi:WD40 repeat protein